MLILKQEEIDIKSYYTLPYCPKINAVIEKFNDIIQVEFLNQVNSLPTRNWQQFEIDLKN